MGFPSHLIIFLSSYLCSMWRSLEHKILWKGLSLLVYGSFSLNRIIGFLKHSFNQLSQAVWKEAVNHG